MMIFPKISFNGKTYDLDAVREQEARDKAAKQAREAAAKLAEAEVGLPPANAGDAPADPVNQSTSVVTATESMGAKM